jgi:hypothetical protein
MALGWLVASEPAAAKYARSDLENVPVDRLIQNLSKRVADKPDDVTARLNLARAMAYALKSDTAQVHKGREDKGAWFGYEPKRVPFTVKPAADAAKQAEAKAHLDQAIAAYKGVVAKECTQLTARLGLAWCLDQDKQKDEAIKQYRALINDAWAEEQQMKRAELGWHSVTAEAADYLIPLLDATKDQQEIETLRKRAARMRRIPRPRTPVVIPLRDGLRPEELIDRTARVAFDLDGSGLPQSWTWITKDAAWLVYEPQRTGKVTSALQLFGNVTFWCFWEDGYQALAALDDNGDGVLTGKELEGLAVWHDRNGDGVCDPGEVVPVASLRIVAISCRGEKGGHPDVAATARLGMTFRDGRSRPTFDLLMQRR